MNRLIRFYNQNRYMVWLVILVLIAIIALIQILNNFASEKSDIEKTINQNNNITTTDKNYSVITGKEVKKEVSKIIDEFVAYCNNKEIEKAYALLSNECKEILYPTVEDFIKNYYNKLFNKKKVYTYQAWITNNNKYTYKLDFMEDMLATGEASNTSILDYYTVIKNGDKYELNINKFVGITHINKTATKRNITINVNKKRVYMDYEIYEIEVENNLKQEIMLDSLQKTKTIYLEDENKEEYYWYNHEILEEDISIRKAQGKQMEIKFDKRYRAKNEPIKIIFSNIIINDEEILNMEILL